MKKKIIYIILIFTMFIGIQNVSAAASVTASSKIYPGTFTTTIKVSNAAMWEVHLSSSGPVKNCSYDEVNWSSSGGNESKTYSITCTATSTGTITLRLTGKTITADGNQSNISDSATVNVVEQPKATPKSSVNTLDNLWVEGVSLDPSFNKDTTEYSVELEADVTSIKIGTTKSDGKSTVRGDGEKSVSEGMNRFDIVVTAENGSSRTYTIKATVKEKEPIIEKINDQEYRVVRKREDLKEVSELYSETTVTINEEEIPAYYGEVTKYTLVGLKDEEGNVEYYIYDEENHIFTVYQEISSQKVVIYPMEAKLEAPKGYKKEDLEINDKKIEAYKNEEKEYYLVYGMNVETGKTGWYTYDSEEGTFQRYIEEEKKGFEIGEYTKMLYLGGAAVLALIFAFLIAILKKLSAKEKSIKNV